ncbi:MAG: SCP2 sterol-binding domain-containing protein [Paracoccaceae bacterium]
MSKLLEEICAELQPRVAGVLKGSARLDVAGEGSVMLDGEGARPGEGPADVVLKASAEVFRAIVEGRQNQVMAVMSGKLKVEGSPQRALKVGAILTGNG